LILSALVVPFAIGTGTQTSINAAVIVLIVLIGLWVLDMVVVKRKIELAPSRPILPLILFIAVVLLAFLAGQLPWFNYSQSAPLRAQLGAVMIFVLSAGAFLLIAHRVQDIKWLKWLVWSFLIVSGIQLFVWFFPQLGRITGSIIQSDATGSLYWTWLAAMAFSQAYLNKKLGWGWRMLLFGIVLAVLYFRFFDGREWVSGWLPPLAGLGVILVLGKPRQGILIAIILGGVAFGQDIVERVGTVTYSENEYSLMTRFEAWKIVLEMVKVNPVLGFGPANYYWYTPLFPILGYPVQFNSHNNYVDILAQTGFLGLLVFLWFVAEIGWLGWRLQSQAPEGFMRAYVVGVLGGLAATLVAGMLGDWFLPFVYNVGLSGFRSSVLAWLFLGGLISVQQILRSQREPA